MMSTHRNAETMSTYRNADTMMSTHSNADTTLWTYREVEAVLSSSISSLTPTTEGLEYWELPVESLVFSEWVTLSALMAERGFRANISTKEQ